MNNLAEEKNAKPAKKNFFEFLTESIGWIQIVVSALLLSAMLGFIFFLVIRGTGGIILAVIITLAGLIGGMIYATRVWKKRGTVDLISRVSASPELDNLEEDEEKKKNSSKNLEPTHNS